MVIENRIRKLLQENFAPVHMEVANESHRHHSPKGAESHFKVFLVSEVFEGLSRIKRQQRIHELLNEELAGPVHALTMRLLSVREWNDLPEDERRFRAIGHHPAGKSKPQE